MNTVVAHGDMPTVLRAALVHVGMVKEDQR